jgi:hypothetical protein
MYLGISAERQGSQCLCSTKLDLKAVDYKIPRSTDEKSSARTIPVL